MRALIGYVFRGLTIASALEFVLLLANVAADPLAPGFTGQGTFIRIFGGVVAAGLAAVGALIVWGTPLRRPHVAGQSLLISAMLIMAMQFDVPASMPHLRVMAMAALLLCAATLLPLALLAFIFTFPSGTVQPPSIARAVRLFLVAKGVGTVLDLLSTPGDFFIVRMGTNPLAIPALVPWHGAVSWSVGMMSVMSVVGLGWALRLLVRRYHAARTEVQRQIKWVARAISAFGLSTVIVMTVMVLGRPEARWVFIAAITLQLVAMLNLAIAVGIAILRGRLFDVRLTLADVQRSREQLVLAREEERRRIRRDLHDGLGPTLASMTLKLDAARNQVGRDPQAAEALLGDLKAQVQGAIADIRRLVYDLRPPALDQLGLVPAIQEQALRFSASAGASGAGSGTTPPDRAGVRIDVDAPQPFPSLPAAVEVAAYRIALEAMTNAVRHAHATSCTVRLAVNGVLDLAVEDDGIGLPAEPSGGVGLASIRERAAELGGTCTIAPAPNGGTRVAVTLPLPT